MVMKSQKKSKRKTSDETKLREHLEGLAEVAESMICDCSDGNGNRRGGIIEREGQVSYYVDSSCESLFAYLPKNGKDYEVRIRRTR